MHDFLTHTQTPRQQTALLFQVEADASEGKVKENEEKTQREASGRAEMREKGEKTGSPAVCSARRRGLLRA
jgi:hypothetical protein